MPAQGYALCISFKHAHSPFQPLNSFIMQFSSFKNSRFICLTVCPRSSDPFYTVTYYMKWVTTSWTDGSFSSILIF